MIQLRLLGGADLRASGAREMSSLLTQPKRIAMLAYLALGSKTRWHSRDTLLAMFWPELDGERARTALRKSVHGLRAVLGKDTIVNQGDGRIGLERDLVWCDATAFEETLAASDPAEALGLYRGDLLAGFHITGSPDFERWIDSERDRLRNLACAAALGLSEQESRRGELRRALFWARRAESIVPEREETVRVVLWLLDQAGDRTGAIQRFEEFEGWLEQEYGSTPSPATRDLIETIRKRPASRTTSPDASPQPRPATDTAALIPAAPEPSEPVPDMFRELVENAHDVIFEVDEKGYLKYVNPAASRLGAFTQSELIGTLYLDLIREDYRARALEHFMRQLHERHQHSYFEFPVITKDGREVWLGQSTSAVIANDEIVGFRAIARDITARKRVEEAQWSLALLDRPTGLFNRRAFQVLAEERGRLARRIDRSFLLLFIEIKNATEIGEKHGREALDAVVNATAAVLRQTCRESDIAARVGETSFAILATEGVEPGASVMQFRLHEQMEIQRSARQIQAPIELGIRTARFEPDGTADALDLLDQEIVKYG